MAQSTTTNANLSYMNADSKPADAGQNLDERSPRQQNDVEGVVAKEGSRDDGSDPEELLSGDGKSWRQWAVDQVKYAADGVAAKSGYNELLPKELDAEEDKTWRRWAAESAIVAKDVAASSAIAAKDAAASKAVKIKEGATARVTSAKEAAMANAAYVRDVAASKRSGDDGGLDRLDQPNADSGREKKTTSQNLVEAGLGVKESLANRLGYGAEKQTEKQAVEVEKKEPSVQDVVDRYSVTSARTPEKKAPAQTSYRKAAMDTGLGLKDSLAIHLGHGPAPDSQAAARAASVKEQAVNTALTWRDTAVSTLNPSAQEKVLSKTITDSISSIPTLLKEKLWVSGGAGGENTDSDDVPVSTHSGSDSGSEKKSAGERPPAGLVNRVAAGVVSSATGVVSSATGVVSSYLPTSVASYLPGPKSPQTEKTEPRTAESTEVDASTHKAPVVKKSR